MKALLLHFSPRLSRPFHNDSLLYSTVNKSYHDRLPSNLPPHLFLLRIQIIIISLHFRKQCTR